MKAGSSRFSFYRPTWAEVDLKALRHNLRTFRRSIPSKTKILFVVKADGYGHGALACSRALSGPAGADALGVSSVEEGIALREEGARLPILILGSLYPFESFRAAIRHRLSPTISSLGGAAEFAKAAARDRQASCHIKVETGMGRVGLSGPGVLEAARLLAGRRRVRLEGLYTHFAKAESDPSFTRRQLRRFLEVCDSVLRAGIRVPLRHAANSAGALRHPESCLEMARPGLAIYGLVEGGGFKPVMSLKTRVVFLKKVSKGFPISYNAAFRTRKPSWIATLPIGYADGVDRKLSNRGSVLLRGACRPIVGMVTMDMLMVDVTRGPRVRVGDEAVLIGRQGGEEISAREVARLSGTIPYEVVCGLSARVPRVYT